jgi:hypothetical protein
VCIKVQWEDRDAQALVNMTQQGFAIEDVSTIDRPRGHVHADNGRLASWEEDTLADDTTSHGIAWSHLDEQIHTSGDLRSESSESL